MKNAIIICTSLLILTANAYFLFSADSIPLKYMLSQSDTRYIDADHSARVEDTDHLDLNAQNLILKKVAPGSSDKLIVKRVSRICNETRPSTDIVAYTPTQELSTPPFMRFLYVP